MYNDEVEVSVFSADDEPYEIYFNYDIFYGIVYAEKEKVYEIRDEMKRELQSEYDRNRKVSNEFIEKFSEKYDVCMPNDIYYNFDITDFSKRILYSIRIYGTGTGGKVCAVLVLIPFPFWIKSKVRCGVGGVLYG